MKAKIATIILTIISLFATWEIIRIDNLSRIPENAMTDYYMNSLPYIYILIISLVLVLIITMISIIKATKKG